jgi:hypothetical protein
VLVADTCLSPRWIQRVSIFVCIYILRHTFFVMNDTWELSSGSTIFYPFFNMFATFESAAWYFVSNIANIIFVSNNLLRHSICINCHYSFLNYLRFISIQWSSQKCFIHSGLGSWHSVFLTILFLLNSLFWTKHLVDLCSLYPSLTDSLWKLCSFRSRRNNGS